jgi:hypothetical protein
MSVTQQLEFKKALQYQDYMYFFTLKSNNCLLLIKTVSGYFYHHIYYCKLQDDFP